MTTIHAQFVGDQAVIPRTDFDQLLELARRSAGVALEVCDEELSTLQMMQLTEEGGAFRFWHEAEENIYTLADGEPI